jgi:hypothetical protein
MLRQALRFCSLFALIALSLSSCRKDKEEVGGADNTLRAFIIGDWKVDSVHVTGDYQSPTLNGEIDGTGFNVSGNWTFREDGTFYAQTKYNLSLVIGGTSMGYGTIDETIEGIYAIKGSNRIELTADAGGEVTEYTISNRKKTSFSAMKSETFTGPDETMSIC